MVDRYRGVASGLRRIADDPELGSTFQQAAKDAADHVRRAIQTAREAATIHNPERLFAERIGEPIAQGMAQGIVDGTADVKRQIDELLGKKDGND